MLGVRFIMDDDNTFEERLLEISSWAHTFGGIVRFFSRREDACLSYLQEALSENYPAYTSYYFSNDIQNNNNTTYKCSSSVGESRVGDYSKRVFVKLHKLILAKECYASCLSAKQMADQDKDLFEQSYKESRIIAVPLAYMRLQKAKRTAFLKNRAFNKADKKLYLAAKGYSLAKLRQHSIAVVKNECAILTSFLNGKALRGLRQEIINANQGYAPDDFYTDAMLKECASYSLIRFVGAAIDVKYEDVFITAAEFLQVKAQEYKTNLKNQWRLSVKVANAVSRMLVEEIKKCDSKLRQWSNEDRSDECEDDFCNDIVEGIRLKRDKCEEKLTAIVKSKPIAQMLCFEQEKCRFMLAVKDGESYVKSSDLLSTKLEQDTYNCYLNLKLFLAVRDNNYKVVKDLMTVGMGENVKNEYGETILYEAVVLGHVEIVELLLSYASCSCDHKRNAIYYAKYQYNCKKGYLLEEVKEFNIMQAAEEGNINIIKFLLYEGRDINAQDENGETALSCAVLADQIKVVKLLLDKGACVLVKDNKGKTALYKAVAEGDVDMVKLLLNNKAYENVTDDYRKSAIRCAQYQRNNDSDILAGADMGLLQAAWDGNLKVAEFLLCDGENVNDQSESGETALYCATLAGHVEMVELLLRYGADINIKDINGDNVWQKAASYRREDIMLLLSRDVSNIHEKDENGGTILHYAAIFGHEVVAKHLLESNIDVNCQDDRGKTALYCASCKGHINIVKILLEHGADVLLRTNDGSALYQAVVFGHVEVAELLLTAYKDIKVEDANRALYYARCQKKRKDKGVKIAELEIDIMQAARTGNLNVLRFLLFDGVSVDAKGENGETALHCAVFNAHTAIVKCLLAAKAKVNAASIDGFTALHYAARHGYASIVELLLRYEANIDAQTNIGLTPMHYAVSSGCSNVVKILLREGANVEIKSYSNRTALDMAISKNNSEIIGLLKHAMWSTSECGNSDMYSKPVSSSQLDELVGAVYEEGGRSLTVSL